MNIKGNLRVGKGVVDCRSGFVFFFFKKKAAYGVLYGLVGSEMCKRDKGGSAGAPEPRGGGARPNPKSL